MCGEGKKINLINVRSAAKYRAGYLAGARVIALEELDAQTLVTDELGNHPFKIA
ncbi:MAG: hypothetical protein OQK44_09615 [Gammaproteobacteria bacterium]|jgi:hypothetical protein|nr:hypothetical protein [Gammaproteobacteria bacterium]MCW8941962.1 hypothetical protein [Gammaproteobacteria bacterium]